MPLTYTADDVYLLILSSRARIFLSNAAEADIEWESVYVFRGEKSADISRDFCRSMPC